MQPLVERDERALVGDAAEAVELGHELVEHVAVVVGEQEDGAGDGREGEQLGEQMWGRDHRWTGVEREAVLTEHARAPAPLKLRQALGLKDSDTVEIILL